MTTEYWKWPESRWSSQDIDWRKAGTITAGLDIGSVSSQAVVLCDDNLFCNASNYTSPDIAGNARATLDRALEGTGMSPDDIQSIVATGFGQDTVPFAAATANEITCHAKGARFMFGPGVMTVVDLGGQTAKAIKMYQWDRIRDFAMNDKCAVNMGYGIEILADLLQVPITEIGERSLGDMEDPEPVSTTCHTFALTETMGLLREGMTEQQVLASHIFAVEWRLYAMIGRISPENELAFTGGLAKNAGIVKRLERDMKMKAVTSDYDPMLAGAIGAAILGREKL
ncbi:MAG: acyl-CoA dehydratase activase [Dehalococcoidales bacterium]|nr:acyl-CoA dehydratase activase [Dehalococcoidales bacterium]